MSKCCSLNKIFLYPLLFQNQVRNKTLVSRNSTDEADVVERTKPNTGYEYDEGIEGNRNKWRIPFLDKKGFFKSKLGVFGSKRFPANITKLNPNHLKYFDFKKWWAGEKKERLIFDQQFNEERLHILGCDLAAAHFVVYRGGAVKFENINHWIRDDKTKGEYDVELPNRYQPEYIVEALDLSGTRIVYEGLRNIDNLRSLKWLSFANCNFFDDWCLDRVSGEYRHSLEHLDISFTKVTHRGLFALYRFKNLKTLMVDDDRDDPLFFETCLEVQKQLEGLKTEIVSSETEIGRLQE